MKLFILLTLPTAICACLPIRPTDSTTTSTAKPADRKASESCPVLDAMDLATCDKAFGYPPNTCTAANRTTLEVACETGKQVALLGSIYETDPRLHGYASKVHCDTAEKIWLFRDAKSGKDFPQDTVENVFGRPITVACKPTDSAIPYLEKPADSGILSFMKPAEPMTISVIPSITEESATPFMASIPMKSADSNAPAGCPVLEAMELATCDKAFGYPPNTCTAADRTFLEVACGAGKYVAFIGSFYESDPKLRDYSSKVYCDTKAKLWLFQDTLSGEEFPQFLVELIFGSPIKVACKPADRAIPSVLMSAAVAPTIRNPAGPTIPSRKPAERVASSLMTPAVPVIPPIFKPANSTIPSNGKPVAPVGLFAATLPLTHADSSASKGCAELAAMDIAICDEANGFPPNTCTRAPQSALEIDCGPGHYVEVIGSKYATEPDLHIPAIKVLCDPAGKQWIFRLDLGWFFRGDADQKTVEYFHGAPLQVACRPI